VNLLQIQIMRTVWMPIIKQNSKKIWSTGKWKRKEERENRSTFFYSSIISFL
jgi:hypothetical protein